jgi:alanyl-tRNA synthetase
LLHAALKTVLGNQVQQAGSLVHPDYLRFDLTYFEKITLDHIHKIENIVNSQILLNNNIEVSVKSFDEAKKDGVIALFGEKYGDQVRVVSSGDFSKELCGGTHVDRTGGIGLFKITEESSLASGVRRIVAVTGKIALKMFQNKSNTLGKIQLQMNCKEEELSERIGQLYSEKKILEKKIKELIQTNDSDVDSWIKNRQKIGEYSFVIELIDISDFDHLKRSGDKLLSQIDSGVGVLFSSDAHKPSAVIVLTDNLIKQGLDAGNLAKEIGSFMGGGGGGKPHLATAGGRDQAQVQNAIEKTRNLILNKLNT